MEATGAESPDREPAGVGGVEQPRLVRGLWSRLRIASSPVFSSPLMDRVTASDEPALMVRTRPWWIDTVDNSARWGRILDEYGLDEEEGWSTWHSVKSGHSTDLLGDASAIPRLQAFLAAPDLDPDARMTSLGLARWLKEKLASIGTYEAREGFSRPARAWVPFAQVEVVDAEGAELSLTTSQSTKTSVGWKVTLLGMTVENDTELTITHSHKMKVEKDDAVMFLQRVDGWLQPILRTERDGTEHRFERFEPMPSRRRARPRAVPLSEVTSTAHGRLDNDQEISDFHADHLTPQPSTITWEHKDTFTVKWGTESVDGNIAFDFDGTAAARTKKIEVDVRPPDDVDASAHFLRDPFGVRLVEF
ncbi:MAG: hypothetical protein GY788_01480 [bacterium]|nr:hypothetical protein [bacterium]